MRLRTSKFPGVCFECPDRTVGCHGICERYLTEKKEFDAKAAAAREKHDQENMMDSYRSASIKRMKEKKKQGRK